MIQIRPVSDLRNKFPEIETLVKENQPVYLTKNGYGAMVVLSLEEYSRITGDVGMKLDEADKQAEETDIRLTHVTMPNAGETLWNCDRVTMNQVTARGDYFAMNSRNMVIDGFELTGNYSFDGVKQAEIHNARLLSKDAFWNSENVTVYDSFISGEYLGWNAKNLTLINCTVESSQGMCYIDNLVMKNCRLLNTTLAFEYSTVDAEINNTIDSVLNPSGGRIRAQGIKELVMDASRVDVTKTVVQMQELREAV